MKLGKWGRQLLALTVALIMVICLIPSTASAASASSVYVGSTQLNDGDSTTLYGGTASFSGGVLTLNGVTVPSTASHSETSVQAAVYAGGDLTIELVGSNSVTAPDVTSGSSYGIYITGAVTVRGAGSLSATGGTTSDGNPQKSCGINTAGSITISSGTIVAAGGTVTQGDSCGIFSANGGNIIINGGTVTATGGAGIGGGTVVMARSLGIYSNLTGNITVNGGTVIASGGTSNSGSRGMQVDSGVIEITGGTVTSSGGAVMPNAEQTDKAIHSYGIYTGAGSGIEISGGTVFGSGGTANASDSTSTSFGIYARNCSISVSGGVVTAAGGPAKVNSYGMYTRGNFNITISGGTVKATADTAGTDSRGIFSNGNITVSGGGIVAAGNTLAVNKLPVFGSTWYQWKANTANADPGGGYTASAATLFTAYDTSKYLRVLPTGGVDPVITVPTADKTVTVTVGSTAAMSVTAQNAVSYQWYKNEGGGFTAVSGATSSSYSAPVAALSNNGDRYYCIVSGIGGTFPVTSKVFALSVTVPPAPLITRPTADKTVTVAIGNTGTMSVTAQNATGYQWYVNRNDGQGFVAISGATNARYTTSAVTTANDGYQYYCIVSGAAGTTPVTSKTFTLRVVEQSDIPATGDNNIPGLWIGLAMLSALGLAGSMAMGRRKRRGN